MSDRGPKTTDLDAHAAQADWIRACVKRDRLLHELAKAESEVARHFRRMTGVNLQGATNG